MDVLTLGCTMEQTVAQMSIVNTVTWKQAPVWTVNLVTKTKGVDQNAQMGNMENIARMIVDIADMYPSAITLTGLVYMDVSRGINNQRVHKSVK